VANALAPIVEQKKIVQVAWVSDTKVTAGRSYSIRMWNSGSKEGKALAEAAFKKGYRRLALFTQLHDYSQSVKAGIIEAGKSSNSPLEIALDEDFALDAKDFRSAILKLKSKQVDALGICPVVPGAAGLIVKQIRQMGLRVPVFGCESVELQGNFEVSEGHLAGVWFSTIAVDRKFTEKFIQLHGEPGSMPGAAVFYDLATMLSRTKSSGTELVTEILSGPSFLGVSGVWKPTKTATDQYLDIPIAMFRYNQDGTQVEDR
jgi:ABC-type branched-subunit amino acid transport system substrate-binding protein